MPPGPTNVQPPPPAATGRTSSDELGLSFLVFLLGALAGAITSVVAMAAAANVFINEAVNSGDPDGERIVGAVGLAFLAGPAIYIFATIIGARLIFRPGQRLAPTLTLNIPTLLVLMMYSLLVFQALR